jgi:phospholipid-binding lipoprotein MlaA
MRVFAPGVATRSFAWTPFSRLAVIALLLLGLAGCASAPGRTTEKDPWEKFNRKMFKFNDTLDHYALKPVATGYKKVTPSWFRTGVGNFFANVDQPVTVVNELLQGKPKQSGLGACRFLVNTVFGVGGLFDVAGRMGLPADNEDFGQTLAVWGMPSGPYLVLPILGPTTLRDGPARTLDYVGNALHYVDLNTVEELGLHAFSIVDTRARLLGTDSTLESAYDKYGIVHSAWIQRREYLIFDGNPPEPSLEDVPDDPGADEPPPATK